MLSVPSRSAIVKGTQDPWWIGICLYTHSTMPAWTVHWPLKSNYSRPECGRKRHKRLISWPLQGKTNNRVLTFLNVYWNFELTIRWLFPWLSRGNSLVTHHQVPPHLSRHDLLGLLPTTTSKEQTLLPNGLCTYHRSRPASPSPTHFIHSQCQFFQNNSHLSSSSRLHRRALSTPGLQTGCLFHTALVLVGLIASPRTWSFSFLFV